jgi:hypothetical protein
MKYALVTFLPDVPPGGVCAGIDWADAGHAIWAAGCGTGSPSRMTGPGSRP